LPGVSVASEKNLILLSLILSYLDLTLQITSSAAWANWSIIQSSVLPSAIVPRYSSKRLAVELKELISSLRLLISNKAIFFSAKPLEGVLCQLNFKNSSFEFPACLSTRTGHEYLQ